ncbi:arylamine N-acetyltransferase, partial [Enterobacter hormaechei]|uniref:arylamine N-acetyltransferase n=1 Tax=Enterobacter hormaechei TaxID=158836 RepID=UPI001CC298CB
FDLQAPAPIDNVVGNWYVCTHPDSSFTGQLRASLTGPDWRRTIGSGNYTEYRPGQAPDKRPLHDVGDVREVLQQRFGMQLPDDPRLAAALACLDLVEPSPCSAELGRLGQQQPSVGSALHHDCACSHSRKRLAGSRSTRER